MWILSALLIIKCNVTANTMDDLTGISSFQMVLSIFEFALFYETVKNDTDIEGTQLELTKLAP